MMMKAFAKALAADENNSYKKLNLMNVVTSLKVECSL